MTRALLFLLLAAAPARATFTLTVSTGGPVDLASIVTSTPSGIVCPGTCSATFAEGSTVTVGEVHPSSVSFVGWGAPCRSNLQSCNVPLTANTTVQATFDPVLDLSISGNGVGSVVISSQPVCSSSGTCAAGAVQSYVYPKGSAVVLSMSTGTGTAFVGWTGDPGCSRASTCTITINGYEHIVATFTASAAVYPLKVVLPNGGGTVTSTPSGIICPGVCSSTFTANVDVKLTTAAAAGYRFSGWANGGCAGITTCVVKSTSPLQGLGGSQSPAAYFYKIK
jgi:hypothetical protein